MSCPPTKRKKLINEEMAQYCNQDDEDEDLTEDTLKGSCYEEDSQSSTMSYTDSQVTSSDDLKEEDWWAGCPLEDVSFGPSVLPSLPSLEPTHNHSVLFHPVIKVDKIPQAYPERFRDVWDSKHVRMPCSKQCLYPVETLSDGKKSLQPRWDIIKQSLTKNILNSHDLEKAIMTYNSVYSKKWKFDGLHSFFARLANEKSDAFFVTILPRVIALALQLPTIVTHAIPLLRKHDQHSISFTQQQVACLLANAFLCTYPRRNTTTLTAEYSSYPTINFNTLYSSDAPGNSLSTIRFNKLMCICHYFARVTSEIPEGTITFERKVLVSAPAWERSNATFTNLHVDSKGTIERNGQGMIQVDFANKYIGGGVLGRGSVQEEIRFLICPELIMTRLFTEELDSNEVIEVTGVETYSSYKGYGSSFEWMENYVDSTPRDKWGRRQTTIIAMDAEKFKNKSGQYKAGMLRREVNKAYCGFMSSNTYIPSTKNLQAVATGKWGCGAFGGDPRLKFVLQLLAAAQANRDMVFFTFGDRTLQKDISMLHSKFTANKCTVGEVWRALLKYDDRPDLYHYLETVLTTDN